MKLYDKAFIQSQRIRSAESHGVNFPYFIKAYGMIFQKLINMSSPLPIFKLLIAPLSRNCPLYQKWKY